VTALAVHRRHRLADDPLSAYKTVSFGDAISGEAMTRAELRDAVIDRLVARVEQIERALRAAGIELPTWDDDVVEEWIAEQARRQEEYRDPRR
jgi:hypothetical protein